MLVLLLSMLPACWQWSYPPLPDRPEAFVDPGLSTTGAGPTFPLAVLPGRWTFGEAAVIKGLSSDGLVLELTEKSSRKESQHNYQAKLPIDVGNDGRRAAPRDMVLRVAGVDVPYDPPTSGEQSVGTWRVKENEISLRWRDEVVRDSVVLGWPGLAASLIRHDAKASGDDVQDFVKGQLTFEGLTRNGLLLPAPATGEWDLTLPEGGVQFEGWLGTEAAPFRSPVSDGAEVVLSVVIDGVTTEVDSERTPRPGADFARWRVDLSDYAGKSVTLRLSARTYGRPELDWAFIGSPTVWGESKGPVRHVLVIGLDTTRPDRLAAWGGSGDVTPELDAIAATSVIFDQAWTPAPRTRPSFRAATTGRDPLEAVGAENVGAVFQRNGFATGAIVANIHLQPRFDFDDGFDSWWFDGHGKAEEQVERALDWLDEHQDRDTFLFLHFMDPHMLYNAPGPFQSHFVTDPDPSMPPNPTRSGVLSMMKRGEMTPQRERQLKQLYDAEMAYLSSELGRLFDRHDRMPGQKLSVLHSDHGEELFEHGGFEHNHALWPELTHALFLVRGGHGNAVPQRISAPVTLVDIAPTLYELLHLSNPPPSDGRSLVPLLTGQPTDWSDRAIGTAHLRYGHERWGVISRQHLFVLHTGTGQEELFDLKADPGATVDLSTAKDLEPFRRELATVHRMEVGPGWRVFVSLSPSRTTRPEVVFAFPSPALSAGVVDPEVALENPTNQEWGEAPRRTVGEIGTVALSEDRLTMTWTPGTNPQDGILWVRFDAPTDETTATIRVGGEDVALYPGQNGGRFARGQSGAYRIEPGTVNIPPPSEVSRIHSMRAAAGSSELELLQGLGYMDDDEAHGPP